jgi:hypothetical protein
VSENLKIVEKKLGVILNAEPSIQNAALVYLSMYDNSEMPHDGHEMYLTREQTERLRDWLTARLTG